MRIGYTSGLARTYNLYRSLLLHFFRWLYYPDVEPGKRPKPTVMENIPQLKTKRTISLQTNGYLESARQYNISKVLS
jgi:hypothetical protein